MGDAHYRSDRHVLFHRHDCATGGTTGERLQHLPHQGRPHLHGWSDLKERGISGTCYPSGHKIISDCYSAPPMAQTGGRSRNKRAGAKDEFLVNNITDVSLAFTSFVFDFSFYFSLTRVLAHERCK